MGYLGQKYNKGIVIQRSEEGSAFQEDVEVTVEGEQELTPKVGGGFKKVTVYGAGGSEVIPNPEMEGDEEHLSSLEIDGTKYNLDGKIYDKNNIVNMATIDYDTAANRAHVEISAEDSDNEVIAAAGVIERRMQGSPSSAEAYLRVDMSGEELSAVKAGFEVDAETGDTLTYVKINADEVSINDQPYSPGTEVIANPTLAGTEANLTGLQVGNTKYKVPQGGGGSVAGINIDEIYAGGANGVKITRLTSTPQPLNLITDPSDLYDYFNSLYINIKEYCQGGYVYDSSAGASIEVDLSKGMYEGVSGTFNDNEIYGIVACVSTNEYGESRRELGTVYLGNEFLFDSGFVIVEEGQVELSVVSILQKSIGGA